MTTDWREEFAKQFKPFIAYRATKIAVDLGGADITTQQLEHCEEEIISFIEKTLHDATEKARAEAYEQGRNDTIKEYEGDKT